MSSKLKSGKRAVTVGTELSETVHLISQRGVRRGTLVVTAALFQPAPMTNSVAIRLRAQSSTHEREPRSPKNSRFSKFYSDEGYKCFSLSSKFEARW